MTRRQRISLGRAIVTYTQRTRRHRDRDNFPLTNGWVYEIARKLGRRIGQKEARAVRHDLIAAGIIEESGSYPQRRLGYYTGAKVTLYRATECALRSETSSGGKATRQVAWWRHPLFGFGVEECPKSIRGRLRKWKEPPEWKVSWVYEGLPV